jgi:hypothetical protein
MKTRIGGLKGTCMNAGASVAPNTREIQSDVNARMLRSRYRELAYCRIMRGRAEAMKDKTRVEFYREGAERARRCVESLLSPRKSGVTVFPEIRAEVRRWVEVVERREARPW